METVLLTVREAAKKTKLTTAALYTAIKEKRLAYEIQYGRVLVSLENLKAYRDATKIGRPVEIKSALKNGKPKRKV